jgi:hypothetical protein
VGSVALRVLIATTIVAKNDGFVEQKEASFYNPYIIDNCFLGIYNKSIQIMTGSKRGGVFMLSFRLV